MEYGAKMFFHNKAHNYRCPVRKAVVANVGFELVEHPPYLPDLTPSDYQVFSKLRGLAWKKILFRQVSVLYLYVQFIKSQLIFLRLVASYFIEKITAYPSKHSTISFCINCTKFRFIYL